MTIAGRGFLASRRRVSRGFRRFPEVSVKLCGGGSLRKVYKFPCRTRLESGVSSGRSEFLYNTKWRKGDGRRILWGTLEFYGAPCFIFPQPVWRGRAKRIAKGISSAVVEGSVRAWGSIAALGGSSAALGLSSAAGKSEAISFRRLTQTTEGSPSDLPWEQRRSQGFFLW